MWPLSGLHLASYGAFASIVGLWGGPFLADIHGLGVDVRGQILLAMALAQVAGVLDVSLPGALRWLRRRVARVRAAP